MSQFVINTESTQNVGRFQAGGGAGRAGRNGDFRTAGHKGFTFNKCEADVEVERSSVFHASVDMDGFDFAQAFPESVAKSADTLHFFVHFQAAQSVGFAHTDDLVCGKGAGAHASFVAAAVDDGFDTGTRFTANVKSTHTFRSVKLVSRKAHQVDFEFFHVQRNLAGGLSGVDVEQDSAFAAHFTDFFDVLNNADFVVDGHHGNQSCIRTHGFSQSVEV